MLAHLANNTPRKMRQTQSQLVFKKSEADK